MTAPPRLADLTRPQRVLVIALIEAQAGAANRKKPAPVCETTGKRAKEDRDARTTQRDQR